MTQFVSDREIYERVLRDAVPRAARRVWIATADIKDLYVEAAIRWRSPGRSLSTEGFAIIRLHREGPSARP